MTDQNKPSKKPINPWRVIGWIVLGFVVLILGSCIVMIGAVGSAMNQADNATQAQEHANPIDALTSSTGEPAAVQETYKLRVIGFTCSENYGRTKAEISFQNIGAYKIHFAKVLMKFGDSATNSSYLQPVELQSGATADTTIYAPEGTSGDCEIVSVQDNDGNPVEVYGL